MREKLQWKQDPGIALIQITGQKEELPAKWTNVQVCIQSKNVRVEGSTGNLTWGISSVK